MSDPIAMRLQAEGFPIVQAIPSIVEGASVTHEEAFQVAKELLEKANYHASFSDEELQAAKATRPAEDIELDVIDLDGEIAFMEAGRKEKGLDLPEWGQKDALVRK